MVLIFYHYSSLLYSFFSQYQFLQISAMVLFLWQRRDMTHWAALCASYMRLHALLHEDYVPVWASFILSWPLNHSLQSKDELNLVSAPRYSEQNFPDWHNGLFRVISAGHQCLRSFVLMIVCPAGIFPNFSHLLSIYFILEFLDSFVDLLLHVWLQRLCCKYEGFEVEGETLQAEDLYCNSCHLDGLPGPSDVFVFVSCI